MLKPEHAEKVLTKNLANVIRKANTGKPLTAAERALIEQAAAGGTLADTERFCEDLRRTGPAVRPHAQDAPKRKETLSGRQVDDNLLSYDFWAHNCSSIAFDVGADRSVQTLHS